MFCLLKMLELVLSFIIGVTIVCLIGTLFSLKTKGLFRLAVNSIAGAVALILLSLFKIAVLPVNPLTALIVGLAGVPGLIGVWVITVFLR